MSVYDRQKRNKPSQLLLALGIGASLVGASLVAVGSLVGFILVIVGVPFTVAVGVWVLKNWEY